MPAVNIFVVWYKSVRTSKHELCLTNLIDKNKEIIKQKYLEYIYDIGTVGVGDKSLVEHFGNPDGSNFWWTSLISEKSNAYKSQTITEVLRCIAFWHWVDEQKISEICVVDLPRNIEQSLRVESLRRGIKFSSETSVRFWFSDALDRLKTESVPSSVRGMVWLVMWLIDIRHLWGKELSNWNMSAGRTTFVNYLSSRDCKNGDPESSRATYWGRFPDTLVAQEKNLNWLHLTQRIGGSASSKKYKKLLGELNARAAGAENHVSLVSFISWAMIFRSIAHWYQLAQKAKKAECSLQNSTVAAPFWSLIKRDWERSFYGEVALSNVLTTALLDTALGSLRKQDHGFFLQENQGWESSLVWSWRRNKHKLIIGFPHTTVRYWDLRYFHHSALYKNVDDSSGIRLPDIVGCSGPKAFNYFRRQGFPLKRLRKVEALRFDYLSTFKVGARQADNVIKGKKNNKLLVVGDYSKRITRLQLEVLVEAVSLISTAPLIVFKTHPVHSHSHNYQTQGIEVSNRSLTELLNECDAVYASTTTSAALDAYLVGLHTIVFVDESHLNLSPVYQEKGVDFVSSPGALAKILSRDIARDMGSVTVADYFYLDEKLSGWTQLINP